MDEITSQLNKAKGYLAERNWAAALKGFGWLRANAKDHGVLAMACLGLGQTYLGLGKTSDAIDAFECAYDYAPHDANVCAIYARHLVRPQTLQRALEVILAGLKQTPQSADLLRLLADAQEMAGNVNAAIEACERLTDIQRSEPLIFVKLGRLLMVKREFDKAEKSFLNALALDADNAYALESLADVYRINGPIHKAHNLLLRRAEQAASSTESVAIRLKAAISQPVIAKGGEEIETFRAELDEFLSDNPDVSIGDPWALGLGPCFYLGYQAQNDRPLQEKLAAYYLKASPSLAFVPPHSIKRETTGKRIRIGIISNFFSKHTVGYLTYGLVAGIDSSRFELVLFRTPRGTSDRQTDRFKNLAPFVDLPPNLAEARKIISEARLDVAHYPEIGIDHFAYFLAFARLAPLQTVAWGHPVTTGIPNVDAFLSVDDMEPTDAASHYTEKLIRLSGLSFCAERPLLPEATSPAADINSRRPSFLCAQSLFKIHPEFDQVVASILNLDAEARVYFLSHSTNADAEFLSRIKEPVGPNIDRVVILPRRNQTEFLHLIASANVILDVPQWSGGKTSLEALALGVPIAHCPGQFMRGRHTRAFYNHMNMGHTVIEAPDDYAVTAVRMAHDAEFRRTLIGEIKANSHKLFSSTESIREMEDVWVTEVRGR